MIIIESPSKPSNMRLRTACLLVLLCGILAAESYGRRRRRRYTYSRRRRSYSRLSVIYGSAPKALPRPYYLELVNGVWQTHYYDSKEDEAEFDEADNGLPTAAQIAKADKIIAANGDDDADALLHDEGEP